MAQGCLKADFGPFGPDDQVQFKAHVHRGLPDSSLPGYARNTAQQAHWEVSSALTTKVFHRPLRYTKHYISPGGWQIDPASGREKGVDVAVALDVVDTANYADVLVLASVDSDLKPALESARARGAARVETTSWFNPAASGGRRQLRIPGVWSTRMDAAAFAACIDHRRYP